jgi:hypothetical protein
MFMPEETDTRYDFATQPLLYIFNRLDKQLSSGIITPEMLERVFFVDLDKGEPFTWRTVGPNGEEELIVFCASDKDFPIVEEAIAKYREVREREMTID